MKMKEFGSQGTRVPGAPLKSANESFSDVQFNLKKKTPGQ